MQTLQLYIDTTPLNTNPTYQRIDLFKDESVSITQTIQNVRDIAKIFTEFSKTFTLPASKTNNIVFQHYNNFNIDNGFDARKKRRAKIELNNIPFKKGTIRLEGTELKLNKIYAYKVTFFGETVNLKDLLEDDELQDLTGLDTYKLDYTDTNIRTNLIGNLDALITPLITHTDQLYYDSGTTGNGNVRWVNSSSTNQVYWKQLKFAIRIHEIILAIQSRYTIANGFASDLVFSNDFFNTSNSAYYNLYMWLHRKKGDVEPASQVSLQYRQIPFWSLLSGSDGETSQQNGGIIVMGGLVTPPNSILNHTLSFFPTNTNLAYNIRVFRNGSLYYQKVNVTGNQLLDEADFTLTAGTFTVQIACASTITFSALTGITWEINGYFGGEVINPGWTDTWRNTSTFSTSTVFEFVITQQIPKMKIIDFLTALFKMFNLTAFVEDDGTIKVQTLDSFYNAGKGVAANTEAWALDEYIDVSKSQVNVALPFKEIDFTYKGLGTFLAKQFQQLENSGWGTITYSLENAKYDAPGDSYKVEVPFEHMQYERLVNATGGGSTDIQWGWSVNENRDSFIGLPLVFYAIKQTSATSISFGSDSGTKIQLTSYIIPSNSLSLNPSTSKVNIHFQVETNEYTDNSLFTDTLFDDYYVNYISDVFDNARRITKVDAYLPLKIIYNLQLNDRVSIGQEEYIINQMTTNLINGKSSIELLNVV
jgi:hypothetical protein